MPLSALVIVSEARVPAIVRSPAPIGELGPMLDRVRDDCALDTWSGNRSEFSPSLTGRTFCGAEFTLVRVWLWVGSLGKGTSQTCDDTRPGFVPLCWDEGPGAPTAGGMTSASGGCSCDVTALPVVATEGVSSAGGVLQQLPIGRRKD